MSLSNITFTASPQFNLVVPVNAGVVKVASTQTGTIGTCATVGLAANTPVNWSLVGNPGPGKFTISAHADPTQADLVYNDTGATLVRPEPYNLILVASDGTNTVQIPISIVVREQFSLQATGHLGLNAFTVTGHGYDPSIGRLTIKGYGPGGVDSNLFFLPPVALPSGLQFLTDGTDTGYLQVNPVSPQDPLGGIKLTGGTVVATIQAYRLNTLYDTPANPATLTVTYDLTSGPLAGTLATGLGAYYDIAGTKAVHLDVPAFYTEGQSLPLTYNWSAGGATGSFISGGTTNSSSAVWQPTGAGVQSVTFTVQVLQGVTVVATLTFGPFNVTGLDPTAVPASNWTTTTAVPVQLTPGDYYPQDTGKKVYFKVKLPDLLSGETATITPTVTSLGGAPAVTDAPSPATLLGTTSPLEVVMGFTIPAGSDYGDMWTVAIGVSVTGGSSTRTGNAQLLAMSNGLPQLRVVAANGTPTGGTGSTLAPDTVTAYTWVQNALPASPVPDTFVNPLPGTWNSTNTVVPGANIYCVGAPGGITPIFNSGAGVYQLQGLLTDPGTFSFFVVADGAGYTYSTTAGGAGIALTETLSVGRISFTAFSSSNPQVAAGQAFTMSWGYSGTGSLYLQTNNILPPDNDTGGLSAGKSLTTSATFSLRGTNVLGEAWALPVLVLVGSAGSSTQLPPSPAIVTINDTNLVDAAWQPLPINGSYADYDHWVIQFKDGPAATPYNITKPDATNITGLELGTQDARRFDFTTGGGYHEMSMQGFTAQPGVVDSNPWDTFHVFPAVRPFTLDKTTALVGEAITVTLGAATVGTGAAGDKWRVVFGDGSATDWVPLSIPAQAKSFGTGGRSMAITVQIESDYSTAQPPVKLVRQSTQTIFIVDQQFQGAGTNPFNPDQATVGFGGEAGFVVTDNQNGQAAASPYLVATHALVRDEVTHELKLMVAAARGRDASSLLGTMAMDVFPLAGRPHTLDLIDPLLAAVSSAGTSTSPVQITQTALPDVVVGQAVPRVKLAASGGIAPYRWFCSNLPLGLKLSVDGVLSGTPTTLGLLTLNIAVQDSQPVPAIAERALTLNVKSDLSIATTGPNLTGAVVGTSYALQLQGSKGVAPYTWAVVSGALPAGLSLTPTGLLVGIPSTANSTTDFLLPATFIVQALDAIGAKASAQFSIALSPMALTVGQPRQTTVFLGQQFKVRVPIMGGHPGYTLVNGYSSAGGTAPFKSLMLKNGIVEAVFNEAYPGPVGSLNLQIIVRDANSVQVTQNITLTVAASLGGPSFVPASFDAKVGPATGPSVLPITGMVTGDTISVLEALPAPPANAAVTLDPVGQTVTLAAPALSGTNVETTFRFTIKRGANTLGLVSREYSVASYLTPAGTGKTFNAQMPPLAVGTVLGLDPQAVAINSAPADPVAGLTRVQGGSRLPNGISLDSISGSIYGTVQDTQGPSSTVLELLDTNSNVVSTISVLWNIVAQVLTVDGALTPITTGQSTDQILTIGGAANVTAQVIHGRLPQGLTLTVASGNIVHLSGRALEGGYFDLSIIVRDATNGARTGLFQGRLAVTYQPALFITQNTLPQVVTGAPYSTTLQAFGGQPPYTWALSGSSPALPTGLALASNGTLSGTTSVSSYNDFPIFVVTDAFGNTAQVTLNLVVAVAPTLVVDTTLLPDAVVGAAYQGAQLQGHGGVPPYTWPAAAVAPALPSGLNLDLNTGALTGAPTAAQAGPFVFQIKDSLGVTATGSVAFNVVQPTQLRITNPSPLPEGRKNNSISIQLAAAGGVSPYVNWTLTSGALPSGITLNASTGIISGIPTSTIDADLTFSVTDSTLGTPVTVSKVLHWVVVDPNAPIWTTASLPAGQVAAPYLAQLAAIDGATSVPLTGNFTISPASLYTLPAGLTLSTGGQISGTTNIPFSQNITFRISKPATAYYTDITLPFVMACATAISTTSLPVVQPGVLYNQTLTATGGRTPYTFTLSVGTLPAGLSLSTGGVLSGTPSASGDTDVPVTIAVSDANGCTNTMAYTLHVRNLPITITTTSIPAGQIGAAYDSGLVMVASAGTAPYTWSATGLPGGFSIDPSTGRITGPAPTATGTYPVTFTASDSTSAKAVKTLNLVIGVPTFAWQSGPQFNNKAWGGAAFIPPNPIPLAYAWMRNFQDYNSAPASGLHVGEPMVIYVTGVQNATATLNIASSSTAVSVTGTLISYDSVNKIAKYGVKFASTPSDPGGDVTLTVTIQDGSNRTGTQAFKLLYKPAAGPDLPTAPVTLGGVTYQASTTQLLDSAGAATTLSYTVDPPTLLGP